MSPSTAGTKMIVSRSGIYQHGWDEEQNREGCQENEGGCRRALWLGNFRHLQVVNTNLVGKTIFDDNIDDSSVRQGMSPRKRDVPRCAFGNQSLIINMWKYSMTTCKHRRCPNCIFPHSSSIHEKESREPKLKSKYANVHQVPGGKP
jgi:hypothetical protein